MATLIQEDGSAYILCGDTINQGLQLTLPDDEPFDLTGATIKSQVRQKPGGYILFEFDVEIPDPTTGWFYLQAEPETTQNLRLSEAWYDVQITWASGAVDTFIPPAPVTIQRDVTRST